MKGTAHKKYRIDCLERQVWELKNPMKVLSMYGAFTYIWLIFMVNVGKCTSPMDGMGYGIYHPSSFEIIKGSFNESTLVELGSLEISSRHGLVMGGLSFFNLTNCRFIVPKLP